MKLLSVFLIIFLSMAATHAAGGHISYQVGGKSYEGYFISPSADAPLVLLIHDWDGLNDYTIRAITL